MTDVWMDGPPSELHEQARAARIESERALFQRLWVAGIADLGGSDE